MRLYVYCNCTCIALCYRRLGSSPLFSVSKTRLDSRFAPNTFIGTYLPTETHPCRSHPSIPPTTTTGKGFPRVSGAATHYLFTRCTPRRPLASLFVYCFILKALLELLEFLIGAFNGKLLAIQCLDTCNGLGQFSFSFAFQHGFGKTVGCILCV
jgi:hypothetical protein